ncbi:MAG: molybdopterin-dependent oxidoreductase [Anaerolineales bacterium]|nr:molybdopterin-dependent oxidoreductase [Anaerolineales bacterium]
MSPRNFGLGALLGALLTAPLIGLMYLADQLLQLPFLPFDLFDWITRVLPGPVITFGIDLMIDSMLALGVSVADTAKTAEQISAVLQFLLIGAVTGAIFYAVLAARRIKPDWIAGLIMGALFGFPLVAISAAISQSPVNPLLRLLWLAALFLAWGVLFSLSAARLMWHTAPEETAAPPTPTDVTRLNRRQFLVRLGASTATITVAGAGLGALLARAEADRLAQALEDSMAHQAEGAAGPSFPNALDPVMPAPGTRPEYTPLKDHYQVFLRTEPTVIDGASWVLPITGLVANPLMLTIDDLRAYPARDQYVTLSCISGRVGTSLISTTLWTGVSLQDLLADLQPASAARYLHITSGDGFYETVDLALIRADERIMLCYAWDGNPLPVDHGFPLRIWIPDRYGMKQPKWITGIEVTDTYTEGYWVERNWDEVARVKATSVIDTVAVDALLQQGGDTLVPVGGIAFAGARGISRVEVRVDGGAWQPAQLRSPLSETTWVIWRYDWPFSPGEHTFEVRCAEGDGTPQIETASDARPSGSTGIHSVTEDVST